MGAEELPNRLVHPSSLKVQGAGTDVCMWFCLCLGAWAPLFAPRLRGKGPERGPPPSTFLPSPWPGSRVLEMRESWPPSWKKRQPAGECLQIGVWNQLGRSSSRRRPVLLGGPKCQSQSPAWPLPLASLAKTFLASSGTAPEGQAAGLCQTCPGAFLGSAPLVPFRSD